jgi:hypothetical protein
MTVIRSTTLAFSAVAVLAIAGCDAAQPLIDDTARKAAKGVITPIVAKKIPFANTEIVTDCIIDNATGSEILDLAKAAVVGVTDTTAETVVKIASKPETAKCIANGTLAGVVKG